MNTENQALSTVSRYLVQRLFDVGARHVFGVPGDYVLDFLDVLVAGPSRWVGTCNELNAGYAADGYARMNGVGAAVVTYGVGGLSIMNAVAGAYAERVPVIVVSGAPPTSRRKAGAMVHHLISNYDLQWDMFKHVTADSAILLDPEKAPAEIDRVIGACLTRKLPVYLELPADVARAACRPPGPWHVEAVAFQNEDSFAECVEEAVEIIDKAQSPVILAGVETLRLGLGPDVLRLVETLELPFAAMPGSKAVLPEMHPQFIGIYQGGWSRPQVKQDVENSDCLLALGVWMTDIDTGLFSVKLDSRRMISAGGGQVRIRNHFFPQVQLGNFIKALTAKVKPRPYLASHPTDPFRPKAAFAPEENRPLTASRLYERLNHFIEDDSLVLLAEPGDAFCAAPEFHVSEAENFIVQTYYASIGFCTPAALGVALARPDKRPVVLTGDGAFQMTAQEISTIIREKCPAVVVVINNGGYLIERVLHDDGPYNDIQNWSYHRLPEAFGKGARGVLASTEGELDRALAGAAENKDGLVLIEAHIAGNSCSDGLSRLGASFRGAQAKR